MDDEKSIFDQINEENPDLFAEFEAWRKTWDHPDPAADDAPGPWRHPKEELDVIDLSIPAIVEARRWLVPDWLPLGETALFSGEGARGKTTILQQLATAAALGQHSNWLGLQVTPLPTLMLLCEDKPNDVLLRQDAINRLYRCQNTDLSGNLVLMPRRGKLRSELGIFDKDGALHPTTFYFQFVDFIKTSAIRLIIIDGRSDVFWGNQNDERHARVFIRQILDPLAAINDGVVVMLMHPSQTGKTEGGGSSGSVQWKSTGRAFAYLEDRDDDPEDEEAGTGGRNRTITLNKGNFSPRDQTIDIRWQDGVFIAPQEPYQSTADYAASRSKAETIFLALFAKYSVIQPLSTLINSANYAPRCFVGDKNAKGIKLREFETAMRDLIERRVLAVKLDGQKRLLVMPPTDHP